MEELLDFVSSFLVEERIPLADHRDKEAGGAEQPPPQGDELVDGETGKHLETLQVTYQTRRLPPGAQGALLFGHDPLSLIQELKRLRLQVWLQAVHFLKKL